MTEKVNFLPLGSIVVVSGGIKKYVIVARALNKLSPLSRTF